MQPMALIDCNNFFVSCERLFRPDLAKKPVLVLSSNDGCVVSRSDEVRALGIAMGEPYFKVRSLCEAHAIAVFSSNFDLYRDISERVMRVLRRFSDTVEVYSVDEAFVSTPLPCEHLDHVAHTPCCVCAERYVWGVMVRDTLLREVGIPVSVGISHTKTLAKIATHIVKKRNRDMSVAKMDSAGVEVLLDTECINSACATVPVGDVWGVGYRRAPVLTRAGIATAFDLARMPDAQVRARMSICGLRTVHELRGIPCFGVGEEATFRKSLIHSRSFAHKTEDFATVRGAVVHHARKVAEILRAEKVCAREIGVCIRVARSGGGHSLCDFEVLELHTNDTITLTTAAGVILTRMFKRGLSYAKAGVVVRDIIPEDRAMKQTLFGVQEDVRKPLMQTVDVLRYRYGDVVCLASEICHDTWHARHDLRSARYTTAWAEIARVSIV